LTKKWSDYTRIKHGKSILGENNPNYGNKWSKEQREQQSRNRVGITLEARMGKDKADLVKAKMAKSRTGRKHSEESIEKIRKANEGENNPAYGKGYRQIGENNPMFGKASTQRKMVQQFSKDGKLIKEFEYLSLVKNDGFNIGNVGAVCNGKLNSSGGFIWKFKE
jgi:hypothetical protein